jgi:hypothetical protein
MEWLKKHLETVVIFLIVICGLPLLIWHIARFLGG